MSGYARYVPEGGAGNRGALGEREPREVELSRMRWWHIEPVLRLEHELFPEETWSAAAFWNELAETDTRHYVVALLDGAVVGYAGLAIFGDEAHVLTIGVTRTVQGGGIGTALLRDLLAAAGPRRVLLDVRVDNAVAQRLYERHGFVPVGRRRRYYQPSGTDALVMAREPGGQPDRRPDWSSDVTEEDTDGRPQRVRRVRRRPGRRRCCAPRTC